MIEKPILIYDGDCGFCRKWIVRWRALTGDQVDFASYQEAASRFPQIPVENFKNAVQLIESESKVSSAAEAVTNLNVDPGS